ncbi:Protein kinase, ATP binding site [Nannochloropsis gaditana]|uniref:Protein kinase, ATP binding site n=1 Tax=Nannochloropsis gaditana TaxID=72520 RepID=W7TG81_9STRA|nr:Protein kinase, ATP binding site [Nannochloropsis gaditana]
MEEDQDSPPPLPLSAPPSLPARLIDGGASAVQERNNIARKASVLPQGFTRYGTGCSSATKDLVDQQSRGYRVRAHEAPPLLYQATLGLARVYEHVRESREKRRPRSFSTSETHLFTSDDGTLRLGPHLPLMLARYRFIRAIGRGTFAQIICAEDTFHPRRRQVAIKILNLNYAEIGKREALCLRMIHDMPEGPHAALVGFHSAFDFMGHFCIVMELCVGGSFQDYIHPLSTGCPPRPELSRQPLQASPHSVGRDGRRDGGRGAGPGLTVPLVREAALHLVKALLLLHNQDVIHADLKPENVLLAGPMGGALGQGRGQHFPWGVWGQHVRLTDLGNAIKSREVELYRDDYEIQTLSYRAPEVLVGGCGGRAFDHKIDMWSLGVLLVELYLGRPLFRASSQALMVKRILSVLGPLPARAFVTGKFYTAYFGPDHRLRREILSLPDDPVQATTALTDPAGTPNAFRYDRDRHRRLVCELLRSQDSNLIGFVCGLLDLDPRSRLSAFQALMHPFLAESFPFTLLKPFLSQEAARMVAAAARPLVASPPGAHADLDSPAIFQLGPAQLPIASAHDAHKPVRGKEEVGGSTKEEGLVELVEPTAMTFRTKHLKAENGEGRGDGLSPSELPVHASEEGRGDAALLSSPQLSPDATPTLSLEDPAGTSPLPLAADVVLLDEEEADEEGSRKENKTLREGGDASFEMEDEHPVSPSGSPLLLLDADAPHHASPVCKKRLRSVERIETGSGLGGGGKEVRKEPESRGDTNLRCPATPLQARKTGQAGLRKWYDEVGADEKEEDQEDEDEGSEDGRGHTSQALPCPPASRPVQTKEVDDGVDSAEEGELFL